MSSLFDRSDYEKQSWRDSYNGGRAAGDFTGTVNAQLDRERAAFQGATWSGSSSQMSALELARSGGSIASSGGGGSGAGSASVTTRPGGGGGSGPGSPRVAVGPNQNVNGGAGPGFSRLVFGEQDFSMLMPKDQQLKRVGIGGQQESLGGISDIGWARTSTGWVPVPSSDMKDRIEDNFFMETSWFLRNYLTPMFVAGQEKGPDFLDPNYSHYISGFNEWREGGVPRRNKDGGMVFTGGGF